jgi:hypothetical protein
MLSLALAIVLIPTHDFQAKDLPLLGKYAKGRGKTVLFGNSVNEAHSKCDPRSDSIGELIKQAGGSELVNVSVGGMSLEDMLYITELGSLGHVKPETVIFPISLSAVFNSTLAPHGYASYLKNNLGITGEQKPIEPLDTAATTFEGKYYGSYNEFSKNYFVNEKKKASCPETSGDNGEFIRYMYWRTYLQPTDPLAGFDTFARRISGLTEKNIKVIFWLPPIDYDDLRTWHGDEGVATVRAKIDKIRSALLGRNFTVIDTTDAVAADEFIDRWCACGHMGLAGRQKVAAQLLKKYTETQTQLSAKNKEVARPH